MADKTLSINDKLSAIQTQIKAPKNLYNSFGKYNYRNAESILESAKPYLKELGLFLTINDSIQLIGDRYYVRATVTLADCATGEAIEVSAYARETEEKKGMDGSQVTGATSSYARKYALNGLFLLDDTKDADTDEYHKQTEKNGIEDMTKELKELYSQTDGKDFDKWVSACGGVTVENYPKMKATLKKQITDKKEKE